MLIKHSAQGARSAMFPWAEPAPEVPARAPEPGPEAIEIARLMRENEMLRGEVVQLRENWHEELTTAEARARNDAAQAHQRDDAQHHKLLADALHGARGHFESGLLPMVGQWATEIATAALEALVAPREGEAEWLARIIAQRLGALDQAAIVALYLAPSDRDGEREVVLQACLPPGTRIEIDPALRSGTARLQLRLGAIDIDPAAGFARLRDVLDAGAGHG